MKSQFSQFVLALMIMAASGAVPIVDEDYPDTTPEPFTTVEPTTTTEPPSDEDFFDGLSFFLGILSSVVILAVAYGVWRFYLRRRQGAGYMSI